jgi:hypothetical protein
MTAEPCSQREKAMVIKLGPDLEKALIEVARRQGVAPEALALQALRDRFIGPALWDESKDEWEQRLRRVATDCGVSLSDSALSSEGLYE